MCVYEYKMDGSRAYTAIKASGTGVRERTLNQPGVSVSMTTAVAMESNRGIRWGDREMVGGMV